MLIALLMTLARANGAPSTETRAIHYELSLPAGSAHTGAVTGSTDPQPDLLDLRVRDADGSRYRLRVWTMPLSTNPPMVCVDVRERRGARWARMSPPRPDSGTATCSGSRSGFDIRFVLGQATADRTWRVAIDVTPEGPGG